MHARNCKKVSSYVNRRSKYSLVVFALFGVLAASCAGKEQLIMPDRFDTEILQDGSKRFSFSLDFNRRGRLVSSGDAASGRSASVSIAPRQAEMERALNMYFEMYPYCDEGYFVYDQGFDGSTYTLLGECQESANL